VLKSEPDGAMSVHCDEQTGQEFDLHIRSSLVDMTAVGMGIDPLSGAIRNKKITLIGNKKLKGSFAEWFSLSYFSGIKKLEV
jgi:hypothetical protein